MTEIDRGRLAALAGFATSAVLLVLTFTAFLTDAMRSLGWQGGEYAYSFVWIALGSLVVGGVVKTAAPAPWRSAGSGLLVAGAVGVLIVFALIVTFIVALTSLSL
ncbi:hypothetical protein GCM10011609_48220 [Lentzea pudingi]|uniref:Uncharacterized protein n=1 Tax=Lentzea pudingi TaxID=1789439 RepID=A0ABQ2IB81_9PSEU|nr:hypothetical protein [Lentzea pudingi]GGN03502.1 hypothetical protein GCM10011609_48220 [Lentzea pudingi]